MKTGDFIWFAVEVIIGALVFFFAAKNGTDSTRQPVLGAAVAAAAAMMYVAARSSYLNSEEYVFSGATGADEGLSRMIYKAQGIIMFLAGCAGVLANQVLNTKSHPSRIHTEAVEMKDENHQSELRAHAVPSQPHSEYDSKPRKEALSVIQQPSVASLNGFELLFKEQERGFRHEPLWLKSLSEADGNEAVAQAKYNRERAAILEVQEIADRQREAEFQRLECERREAAKLEKERELKEFVSEVTSDALKAKAWEEYAWNLPGEETMQTLRSKLEQSIPRLRVEGFDDVLKVVTEGIKKLETLLELHKTHQKALVEIARAILEKNVRLVGLKLRELSPRFEDLDYKEAERILHRSDALWGVAIVTTIVFVMIAFGVFFAFNSDSARRNQPIQSPDQDAPNSPVPVSSVQQNSKSGDLKSSKIVQPASISEMKEEVADSIKQIASGNTPFFTTENLPTALGLTVKGRLPKEWIVRHNPNTGGVIIALPPHEKFGFAIELFTLDGNSSIRATIEAGDAKQLLPPKGALLESEMTQIAGKRGLRVEFRTVTEYQGQTGHASSRYYWVILNKHILGLHFFVIEESGAYEKRLYALEPLFDAIARTITIVEPSPEN